VPIGEAEATDTVETITQAYYTSDAKPVKIWEPNNDVHSTAVVNSVGIEYGFTGSSALTATGSTPVTYYGMITAIPQAKPQNLINTVNGTTTQYDSTTFSEAMSTGTVTDGTPEYSTSGILLSTPLTLATGKDYKIFDLAAGITKMRVYMWIEGQDIDCENNASGTDITYYLELSIRETAETPSP